MPHILPQTNNRLPHILPHLLPQNKQDFCHKCCHKKKTHILPQQKLFCHTFCHTFATNCVTVSQYVCQKCATNVATIFATTVATRVGMGTYNWLARLYVIACWLHYTYKYVISLLSTYKCFLDL